MAWHSARHRPGAPRYDGWWPSTEARTRVCAERGARSAAQCVAKSTRGCPARQNCTARQNRVTATVSTTDTPLNASQAPGRIGFGRKAKAYLALTKPRVIELLLVSTLPTMIYAERGFPSLGLIMATLVGGAFAAGSAGAFNCYIDRDIDKLMHRTEKRPLVTGEVTPREALIFAWLLGAAAIAILWFGANPLSAWLGLGAIVFYVVIYMVIFLWTPPHYWPLSMRYGEDYRNANVPMLGAIAGAKVVSVQVVLYAWAMVACSLLLIPVGGAGWVYTVTAVAAGAWFLYESHALYNRAQGGDVSNKGAMKVFHGSISYLTLLFIALAVDPFVGSSIIGG